MLYFQDWSSYSNKPRNRKKVGFFVMGLANEKLGQDPIKSPPSKLDVKVSSRPAQVVTSSYRKQIKKGILAFKKNKNL